MRRGILLIFHVFTSLLFEVIESTGILSSFFNPIEWRERKKNEPPIVGSLCFLENKILLTNRQGINKTCPLTTNQDSGPQGSSSLWSLYMTFPHLSPKASRCAWLGNVCFISFMFVLSVLPFSQSNKQCYDHKNSLIPFFNLLRWLWLHQPSVW